MFDSDAIGFQINLKAIIKRPLRLTSHSETENVDGFVHLKLIGEELWRCNADGITVYDCQWKKLREITLGLWAIGVAALNTRTVVIATRKSLVMSSTLGMNIRVNVICMFYKFCSIQ